MRPSTPAERATKLSERVQALRMPPIEHEPRSAWIPWTLCAVLSLATAWLGYLVFVAAPFQKRVSSRRRGSAGGSAQDRRATGERRVRKDGGFRKGTESRSGVQGLHHRRPSNPRQPEGQRDGDSFDDRRRKPSQKGGHPGGARRRRLPHRLQPLRRRAGDGAAKTARTRTGQPARGDRTGESPAAGSRGAN